MDMVPELPTWDDVGLCPVFVQNLRDADILVIETLYYDRVCHHTHRLQCQYACGVCGLTHKPQKSTDDYTQCESCGSHAIRSTFSIRPLSTEHGPGTMYADGLAPEVVRHMNGNYARYLGHAVEKDTVSITSKVRSFTVNFWGGETVEAKSMGLAVLRASVLVPFLWDKKFDWKENRRRSGGQGASLTPTIHEFSKHELRRK